MNHLTEQDLILHYYGEVGDVSHLDACPECRSRYRDLQSLLNVVSGYGPPERAPDFESATWKQLSAKLPLRSARTSRWSWFLQPRQWAASGALALLLVGAFYAGRLTNAPVVTKEPVRTAQNRTAQTLGFNDRVLLTAVGNHLDRSQYVLTELNNEEVPSEDVTDLLEANRLYRQSAQLAGENAVAELLDELERMLVEIEHLTPATTAQATNELRERLRGRELLFRVRVLGAELRDRDETQLKKKEH